MVFHRVIHRFAKPNIYNVKKLNSTFKSKQTFILVMLSLMLISTSCTVRNYLQNQFNLTETGVTNLSKFTVQHQANCLNLKEQVVKSSDHTSSVEITKSDVALLTSLFLDSSPVEKSTDYSSVYSWSIKSIPFYLLYQNLKLLD